MKYNKFIEVDNDAPVYSKRIAAALNKCNMSQKDLANMCVNVSESTLTAWIKGDKKGKRTEPKIEGLNEVAKALGVSLDYLVGNTEVASPKTDMRAACEFTGLSEQAVINLRDESNSCHIEFVNHLLERGFIRAEVISFDDLMACGSMVAAKEKGLVRSEGKEYVMKDGDVVLFRFNV